MDERIMALHPEGKTGTRIDRGKYEIIKDAILKVINLADEEIYVLLRKTHQLERWDIRR